jgi:hypothetical protein
MTTTFLPTTTEIALAFGDEIATLGGAVSDSYDDGARLFMRAQLAAEDDVRPSDTLKAGVALRAVGPIVTVHPYTYRKVCSNGAIAAQVTGTRQIQRVEFVSATEFIAGAIAEIRFIVRQCAAPEVFAEATKEMRLASAVVAEAMVNMLPMLERVPAAYREHVIAMLGRELETGNDASYYGVMNAVTAVARETSDPETKWRLEEVGGSIPALARRSIRKESPREELVAV